MTTNTYTVTGMTCGGCVGRVKTTLSEYANAVEVTLNPPVAVMTNPTIGLDALNAALGKVGHYSLSALDITDAKKSVPLSNLQAPKPITNITDDASWFSTYKPLLLVFAYILLVALIIEYTHGTFELHRFMPNFMAGFFLVFSFFKLLNLQGFADSYAMYDLLAIRFKPYSYLYAFIELGLGIAYLLAWQPVLTNWLTLIVMTFSSLGVIRAVMNKQKIRCACLGAVFNLPMSTVTIIEDLLMAAMALWMLI
jgi:copper chaperone CopZ